MHVNGCPDLRVAVTRVAEARYPDEAPYSPGERYPEYPFGGHLSSAPNRVYEGVRDLLRQLGFDASAYGTCDWNPLGWLIEPGMHVVIKPNFVVSSHKQGKDLYAIITHPSVLRAVIDYCWIALKGDGEVIVADAPQYDCNFQELLARTRLDEVCRFFAQFDGARVSYRDLRRYWSGKKHFASMLVPLAGDPEGNLRVDLGRRSALHSKPNAEALYGAVYHRAETVAAHSGEKHEYELSRTILGADVVISVPKLKVHKKVGVTLNAKGLVGMATNKNLIVHYTLGSPREGGDQYPDGLFSPLEKFLIRTERWMYDHFLATRRRSLEYLHRSAYWIHNHSLKKLSVKVAEEKRLLDAGNWHGNDSAWRMVVDLMRILYFCGSDGVVHDMPQRGLFSIIDGVIGGEGNGPLTPDPKAAGALLGGANLLAVDLVAARLMGFDPLRMKMYAALLNDREFDFGVRSLGQIQVLSDSPAIQACLGDRTDRFFDFEPHPGWKDHIEMREVARNNE